MYERLGLEKRDVRNMGYIVGIMTLIMVVVLDAPLIPRLVAAVVLGCVSAAVFLVVTVLINVFGPY